MFTLGASEPLESPVPTPHSFSSVPDLLSKSVCDGGGAYYEGYTTELLYHLVQLYLELGFLPLVILKGRRAELLPT